MAAQTETKKESELRYIKTNEHGNKEVNIGSVCGFNAVNEALEGIYNEMELILNTKLGIIMQTSSPHLTNEEKDHILYIVRRNFGEFYGNTKKETASKMADIIRSRF